MWQAEITSKEKAGEGNIRVVVKLSNGNDFFNKVQELQTYQIPSFQ